MIITGIITAIGGKIRSWISASGRLPPAPNRDRP